MTGRALSFRLPHGVTDAEAPIRSRDQLIAHLAAGESPDGPSLLGVELEMLPIRADGTAAPFSGERGVSALLGRLAALGLESVERDGRVIGLRTTGGAVHLEPGAQVELALRPRATAWEVLGDILGWRRLLDEHAEGLDIGLATLGLQPVTPIPEIEWIPRNRYQIMRDYLAKHGTLGHHMMKATAGAQFTVDYKSERDAAEIVQATLAVSPIVNAACASSPLEEGRPNGFLTKRPHIWLHTDPSRTGILPWIEESGFSYSKYVEWALAAPLMFVLRDDRWIGIGDRTFEQFMASGHPDVGAARHEDFVLHLTTLFPEVRIKQHVEIRGADSCSPRLVASVAALWRGLLYHGRGCCRVPESLRGLTAAERQEAHEAAGRVGLAAKLRGRTLADLGGDVVEKAAAGLVALDGPFSADLPLLQPLREILASGRTPAEDLLADWKNTGPEALAELT